eukprot:TRINITY_DN2622_c0_g1_i1.p1 TRINITY_DN2622_c0_g1~~TRINITY_DN2622_c0_g1_i1.p1  ORF type:complete len:125 (+),score=30.16 TRINITY_DN2622_c0_g1_i1:59-433(+)
MLISVRYGDSKVKNFNANCPSAILLDFVRKSCGYPEIECIDLADDEGVPKRLYERPEEYATNTLANYGEHTLLKVSFPDGVQSRPSFTALLEPPELAEKFIIKERSDRKKEVKKEPPPKPAGKK